MARDTDPESRPISVAELLARRAAEADGGAPDTSDESRPAGRRRRGGEGAVSVAELTGEIPRIRGGAHSGSFPAIDPSQAAESAPATGRRRAPDAQTSAPAVDEELTEAAPSTGDLAAESSFVPDDPFVGDAARPSTFPRSDRPTAPGDDDRFPRSESPRPSWAAGQAWSSPTPARPDQPPATRDLNSADVHARFAESDRSDEVTGIIPRFGEPPADTTDEFAGLSPEERDRAFESYRNFDDVDVEEQAPRKRRGLFGALRRSRTDDGTPRTADEPSDDASLAHTELLSTPSDDGRLDVRDDTPTELTDVSQASWGAQAWSDRPDVDDAPQEASAPDVDQPRTTRFAADTDDDTTGVVDLDEAQRHDTVRPAWRGADTDPTPEAAPQADVATEGPSPARQWAMLGLQVVAGLIVGVGLFLGFTELWRWNVYFALVLAVVVIFGLVTFVHVVRRSSDLVSTLIALAVGLIVTIGPLALLASGS
ncbi:MAG: hypothetical protein PGN29_18940 [Gordonia paraffinivorans]